MLFPLDDPKFSAPYFQNHERAREYLEKLRWSGTPTCGHCGSKNYKQTKIPGTYRCCSAECRQVFNVATNTIFQASHTRLHIWLRAFAILTALKSRINVRQLRPFFGLSYHSASFLVARIVSSIKAAGLSPPPRRKEPKLPRQRKIYKILPQNPPLLRRTQDEPSFAMTYFKDEEAARKYLETMRWGNNPKCPHCSTNKIPSRLKTAGKYRCTSSSCRKSFDVTSKTLMQGTRAGLHLWLQAFSMITASKKQVSVHILHRKLRITYRTAWFLNHSINQAMEKAKLSRNS